MTFRPTTGSPIINVQSSKVVAYWTETGPIIHVGQTYNFAKPMPERMNYNDMDELMSAPITAIRVYLIFGKPGDAVQVWGTEADKPGDFDRINCFTPHHTVGPKAEARTVSEFLKLRVSRVIAPQELSYLEGFARAYAA